MHSLVHIRENSLFARIAAARLRSRKVALVFGRTIHLWNTTREEFLKDHRWVNHELKHIQQYQELGIVSFLLRYLWESLRRGYVNNRFEIEARLAENDNSLRERYRFHF